jgi:hypothetical protein
MRRILFVLLIAVVTALAAAPPIAARTAEPLLTPSIAILDVEDEAEEIGERVSQVVDWLLGNYNDNPDE